LPPGINAACSIEGFLWNLSFGQIDRVHANGQRVFVVNGVQFLYAAEIEVAENVYPMVVAIILTADISTAIKSAPVRSA
jgi:hypothetical protein